MKQFLKQIRYLWRRWLGYHICPACKHQSVKLETDNPIHPDGPPLFGWWQCHQCGARSEVTTPLLDSVAPKFGYRSFKEMLKEKGYLK